MLRPMLYLIGPHECISFLGVLVRNNLGEYTFDTRFQLAVN